MLTAATIIFAGAVMAAVYWLGLSQGRHLERLKDRERDRKLRWIIGECLRRWSPLDRDVSETYARLCAEYESVKGER